MKSELKVSVAVILLITIVWVVLSLTLNSIVKSGVETVGPKMTGTTIGVEDVDFSLFSGQGRVQGLVIGNPEGFQTEYAFKLQDIHVRVDLASGLTDKLVIKEIIIDNPEIMFEGDPTGTNISKIKENLEVFTTSGAEEESPNSQPHEIESSEQKVQIDHFIIKNAQVNVSATFLKGNSMLVPLADMHLRDIGKQSEGATLQEVASQVFGVVYNSIVQVVPGAKPFMQKGLKNVEETVKGMSGSAGKAASKVLEGVKGFLGE